MKRFFAFVVTVCFLTSCSAQSMPEKLEAYLQASTKHAGFNGTVLVAKDGKILLEKGYGFRNAESKINHDENSVFQIGSVTKQFTATIIQKLQMEGKLSVKDKLSKYFPQYAYANKITLEDIIHHQSGIYNYTNDEDFMKNHITETLTQEAFWKMIKDKPLDFEPGTKFNYSNSGYQILGYVIEKVTGQPYEAVVRKYLFQPAQMNQSGFDFTHLNTAGKSVGYMALNKQGNVLAPIVDSTVAFSAGAIYSTVHDLYNWNTALNEGKLIPPEVLATSYIPFKEKYGYGFSIDSIYDKRRISHGGGIHGFVSSLTYMPDDKVNVIMLSNNSYDLGPVQKGILAILYGRPYKLPEETKEIKIDSAILKQYVGEYELAPGFTITVKLANGVLTGQGTGQPAFELFAKTEKTFFIKVVNADIDFVKNSKGEVESMVLHQGGRDTRGKKIK
jgi:CubicO group peptidase (beta-lactamase class C family)